MKNLDIHITIQRAAYDELSATDRRLVDLAIESTANSYAPYSNFHVGAALLLSDGTTFIGANQENAAYPSGLCAERTALFAAQAQHPDLSVRTLAIAARGATGELTEEPVTPCGACRQAALEIEERGGEPIRILLYGTRAVYIAASVKDLLPLSFTKNDLL